MAEFYSNLGPDLDGRPITSHNRGGGGGGGGEDPICLAALFVYHYPESGVGPPL